MYQIKQMSGIEKSCCRGRRGVVSAEPQTSDWTPHISIFFDDLSQFWASRSSGRGAYASSRELDVSVSSFCRCFFPGCLTVLSILRLWLGSARGFRLVSCLNRLKIHHRLEEYPPPLRGFERLWLDSTDYIHQVLSCSLFHP